MIAIGLAIMGAILVLAIVLVVVGRMRPKKGGRPDLPSSSTYDSF